MNGHGLNRYFNLSKVKPNPTAQNIPINISFSLTFYSYCQSPLDLINKIIKSRLYSIGIWSIHDMVPTIVYSRKYYSLLKLNGFIKCAKKNELLKQMLEVNYVLLNKYFRFYDDHVRVGDNILKRFEDKIKVGIHVRLHDNCLRSCPVDYGRIYGAGKVSKRFCNSTTKCVNILSSFSKNFTMAFANIYNNTYTYNQTSEVKHSAFSVVTRDDVQKIVVDLYLASQSDIILVNGYSTYSLIILYKGYFKNYRKCIAKPYGFWTGGALYDHLNRFRKKNDCKNISRWFFMS